MIDVDSARDSSFSSNYTTSQIKEMGGSFKSKNSLMSLIHQSPLNHFGMIMASSKDSDLAAKRRQHPKGHSISTIDPTREIHPIPEKHEVDKSQVLNIDEASTSENVKS